MATKKMLTVTIICKYKIFSVKNKNEQLHFHLFAFLKTFVSAQAENCEDLFLTKVVSIEVYG